MTYKYMTLTAKESYDGKCLGWAFATKNRSRWKDAPAFKDQLETYDHGKTSVIIDNTRYFIHTDFLIVTESVRLYILKNMNYDTDTI